MYARLVRFAIQPGKQAAAQAVADDIAPLIKQQPGCQSVAVFADDEGECGIFVLWDSEENANKAAQIVRPQLEQRLAGNVKSAPDGRLFKVISG